MALEKSTSMLTSLSFIANMMALACSAAFPTIGSKMTLMKARGILSAIEAHYKVWKSEAVMSKKKQWQKLNKTHPLKEVKIEIFFNFIFFYKGGKPQLKLKREKYNEDRNVIDRVLKYLWKIISYMNWENKRITFKFTFFFKHSCSIS